MPINPEEKRTGEVNLGNTRLEGTPVDLQAHYESVNWLEGSLEYRNLLANPETVEDHLLVLHRKVDIIQELIQEINQRINNLES